MQSVYKKEIIELKEQINALTIRIAQLLDSFQGQNPNPAAATNTQSSTSKSISSISKPAINTPVDKNRKYNILLFGLKECAKGTNRFDHMKESGQIVEIFCTIEKNIGPQNIWDNFRLGKYNESSSRPHPTLVKLNRSYDVSTLLAARNKLRKGLTLKPDLSPRERAIDKILMEERWKLIQAGQNRKDIKILGSKLLLKGRVHGSVVDST